MADMWLNKDGEIEVEIGGITSSGNVVFRNNDGTGVWLDGKNGNADFEFGGVTTGGRVNISNNQSKIQTNNSTKGFSDYSDPMEYLLQGNPSAQRKNAIKWASLKDFDSPKYIDCFTHAEKAILYRERAKRTKQSGRWDWLKFILLLCTGGMMGGGSGALAGASLYEGSSLDRKFSKIKASTILTDYARKNEKKQKNAKV